MEELTFDNLTEIEFLGHNFVFTGLTEKQEKEATKYVLRMQGIIRSSVVLQTDYLVVGTNQIMPTTKASRALELREKGHSLKIIEWDSFLALANAAMEQTTCLDFIISDGVLEHYYGQQKHVVVPEGVTAITNAVFAGKSDYFTGKVEEHYMESIVLPQTLNSIGDYAFYNFKNLEGVGFAFADDSLMEIGSHAFEGCEKLKGFTVFENITEIGDYAFNGCDSLENVYIINPDCVIADSEFVFPANAEICGYAGSTAQAHAEKYGLDFAIIEEEPVTTTAPDSDSETTTTTTTTTPNDSESELPQTGFSKAYDYLAFSAGVMALCGIYAMKKGKKKEDEE